MSTDNKMVRINLDKYRWKNRLVLIFARSSEESSYLKQKSEFERKTEEINDRNIIVIELLREGGSKIAAVSLNHEQQSFLRRKFDVPVNDFEFILIGKDGTVKLRTKKPVLSRELFGLIDSMPIRKEEMRRKANRSLN